MSQRGNSTLPTRSHAGQRALVTAAASGIGRVTAHALLDAGAHVFVCDSDRERLAAALAAEPRLQGMHCDVSVESDVRALFANAVRHLGGLDILVHNAGTAGPTALVEDISLADWRQCLAVNLDGSFLCARESEGTVRRRYTDAVSLQTFMAPEDIASTVLFLTSSAGARISGQDITVDGHTETL